MLSLPITRKLEIILIFKISYTIRFIPLNDLVDKNVAGEYYEVHGGSWNKKPVHVYFLIHISLCEIKIISIVL